jgi:hypothetical protein
MAALPVAMAAVAPFTAGLCLLLVLFAVSQEAAGTATAGPWSALVRSSFR